MQVVPLSSDELESTPAKVYNTRLLPVTQIINSVYIPVSYGSGISADRSGFRHCGIGYVAITVRIVWPDVRTSSRQAAI